jgi:hypothetical protein
MDNLISVSHPLFQAYTASLLRAGLDTAVIQDCLKNPSKYQDSFQKFLNSDEGIAARQNMVACATPTPLGATVTNRMQDGVQAGEINIAVPKYDVCIHLLLPNGEIIEIAIHPGSASLEINLPQVATATNMNDVDPAQPFLGLSDDPKNSTQFAPGHVRLVKQVAIDLKPEQFES